MESTVPWSKVGAMLALRDLMLTVDGRSEGVICGKPIALSSWDRLQGED
jgi:hypothetical protein